MKRALVVAGVTATAGLALVLAPAGIFVARWEAERFTDWWHRR